jgi:hypothetical protein
MDRSPAWPFWEPFPPSSGPEIKGPDPVHVAAYRGAIAGADAYRAVRQAVRIEGDLLRIGNRFVTIDQYKEIGFVAAGNAAVSQALGLNDALGPRLTQGFLATPLVPPTQLPFQFRMLPPELPGQAGADKVVGAMDELARGLGAKDLLIVLLSAGSLGALSLAPPSIGDAAWRSWLNRLLDAGATGGELGAIARVLSDGLVGGRLAAAAGGAEVVTLIIDHGEGGVAVGGGPTRAVTPAERTAARSVLERVGAFEGLDATLRSRLAPGTTSLPALPLTVGRPVVVANPAEGLAGAADAVGERKWMPRLGALRLDGGPETASEAFLARIETLVGQYETAVHEAKRNGLVIFAMTTLGLAEGVDERPAMTRFLETAAAGMRRRDLTIGIMRTAGASDGGAPAGVIGAAGPPRGIRMASGITDVGCLAVGLVPMNVPPSAA